MRNEPQGHVRHGPTAAWPGFIHHAAARLAAVVRQRRAERQLRQLSDAQLRDIGLDRTGIALAVRHGRDGDLRPRR